METVASLPMAASSSSSRSFRLLFLFSSVGQFLYVLCWHFGSEAASLEQSKDFGWFFKYLTFYGFNLQIISLFISILSEIFPKVGRLDNLADVLSCISFSLANVITVMFWSLLTIINGPGDQHVRDGVDMFPVPPLWISLSMHLVNSIVSWIDIISVKRSFTASSFICTLISSILYIIWVAICRIKNKGYPYPFLNAMPEPQGFIAISFIACILLSIFFWLGSKLTSVVHNKNNKEIKRS